MSTTLLLVVLPLAVLVIAVFWWRSRLLRRERTLFHMLDLADEVERLLDRSQERMAAMQAVVGRVPADIGAVAQASLESSLPVKEAKRDVLQHRLWIQRHGDTASQAELDSASLALERVRDRLAGKLDQLDQAGADLAKATAAELAAAEREPASLRRTRSP